MPEHRADSLLTLGLIGLGLAHELNSPLTATALGLELLAFRLRSDSPPSPSETADEIDRALGRVQRMGQLVDRFRRFARGEGGAPEKLSLDEVADAVIGIARPALAELSTVTLSRTARAPEALVYADRLLLEQAVAIAVLNASDALETFRGAGRIEVAVHSSADGPVLEVLDDGPGFPEALDATAIGVSTKGEGGMGIGLALAGRIVASAGGRLIAGNRVGADGAVVRFMFRPA